MIPWNKGLSGEEYLKHYKNKQTWNKGLTKDTDDRIEKYAKKAKGQKFTKEHRENISKNKKAFLKNNPDFIDKKSEEVRKWWEEHPEKKRSK